MKQLSSKVWRIKDLDHHAKVKMGNIKNYILYNPQTKHCLLCLNKLEIAAYQEHSILNTKKEITSKF